MSRYADDWDGDYENAVLDQGRWERNSRAALKSKRGRKALAEIREALLALPEKRLIEGAMCIVPDVDKVLPAITDEDIARDAEASAAWRAENGLAPADPDYIAWRGEHLRETREAERQEYSRVAAEQGSGVCLVGAYLWHRKVGEGADPAEAFASLPVITSAADGDPLNETAETAAKEAGIAYTLAWNLAYRNDETYRGKSPEERYTAFLAWVEGELAESAP